MLAWRSSRFNAEISTKRPGKGKVIGSIPTGRPPMLLAHADEVIE
jgi:hypothetical protein